MTGSGPAFLDLAESAGPDGEPLSVSPPVRVERPVMVQQWVDVVFIHWPLPPDRVQRLLPPGVEVDTFEGRAWVGLVPFRMEGLGFPGLSPLPLVGTFPEVNVRTYVRSGCAQGCLVLLPRRGPLPTRPRGPDRLRAAVLPGTDFARPQR